MLAVEDDLFKGAAGAGGAAGDHEGELGCDVKITAAVVADIQHQVGHVRRFEGVDRIDKLGFGGGDVIVEEQVAHGAGRGRNRRHVLHGRRRDIGRLHRHRVPGAGEVAHREAVRFAARRREQAGIEGRDAALRIVIDQVHPIHKHHFKAARQVRSGRRRIGLGVGDHDTAGRN